MHCKKSQYTSEECRRRIFEKREYVSKRKPRYHKRAMCSNVQVKYFLPRFPEPVNKNLLNFALLQTETRLRLLILRQPPCCRPRQGVKNTLQAMLGVSDNATVFIPTPTMYDSTLLEEGTMVPTLANQELGQKRYDPLGKKAHW